MRSFYEYIAWRQRTGLPDHVTMLHRAGIVTNGPHEADVMRIV